MKTNISSKFPEFSRILKSDTRSRFYLSPIKVVKTFGDVKNAEKLTERAVSQATLFPVNETPCVMKNTPGSEKTAVLLDYGRELHGCARIAIWNAFKNGEDENVPFKARIRFGESVSEAITPIGTKNARNDHAIRDTVSEFSFMSANETGETGFRYVYFEIEDEDIAVEVNSIGAVLIINDFPYLGSFESSDEKLNEIWKTAAYTVQLCAQEYFWDGIKRDRIVWHGDTNCEICTAYAVFGDVPQIKATLDFAVETTPLPEWMNGFASYSFWWLLNLHELYMHTGDVAYLNKHKEYITGLTKQILDLVSADGSLNFTGDTFVDWSTAHDEELKRVAFCGMLGLCLLKLPVILNALSEESLAKECLAKHGKLKSSAPKPVEQKIASALLSLGGLADAKEINDILSAGGAAGYSAFMGYSILNAKVLAGNLDGAISAIRDYWGGMLDMGATTFWEDFDIDWMKNATKIDEFPVEGKSDIHGDFGKHCYIKLRHSLCHGWSSGPCPWMSRNILGIHILDAGMKKVLIKPYLGDLEYAKGSIPTPFGILSVSHSKDDSGKIVTEYTAPDGVEVIVESF